jgi:peptidyl-prolyl cis-trans isomerase D
MFEFVRTHNKIMQFLLFLLVFPSFVLVGINGYNRMREKGDAVAKVDGHEILQGDWDAAHREQVENIRARSPDIDPKLLDSPQVKYATLERMVRDRVVEAAAHKDKLTASDAALARELGQLLAPLRGPNGAIDMDKYRAFLASRGMSPEAYEESVRATLTDRQVMQGVMGTSFTTPAQASSALDAYFEKRQVQVANFDARDYVARVNPADADVEAYYKAHPQEFQAPEQADIQYVVLDLDAVKKGITVSDADLKTYYEQNIAKYSQPEERRASHILIAAPKNAPPAEKEKAKAKAEDVLAQARKNPGSFAELAKKYSQDEGSAKNGGDLDWQTRGAFVKPVEDAIFSLKKGEISGIVESDYGYHIIKLTDVKEGHQKTFVEVRPELESQLKQQQAQRKFAEVADTFSNAVYEQADSLKPAADKLGLAVQSANGVLHNPAKGQQQGVLANPKFLAALFAPDSVEKKHNTEAVEVAPSTLVSGRVVKYSPAHTLPLADVKDKARQRVIATRSAELAKKDGIDKLAAWKANPASASLPAPELVSRQEGKQPQEVTEAALRADPAALPAFAGVDLGEKGYAVVKVDKVVPRDPPKPEEAKMELQQYERWWASAEGLAYYNLLKTRFKAQILVPKPPEDPNLGKQ